MFFLTVPFLEFLNVLCEYSENPLTLILVSQIYKRLVDIMSQPATDAQAAAIGALYNLSEINIDCRLKLASERWWDRQSDQFTAFYLVSVWMTYPPH